MKKILLIDDDEDDQLLFKVAIKSIDPTMICDTSTNGKIALDKLKVSTVLPDLIFLDLNMPIMNGFDFLVHIKKEDQLCRIPIGILTTSKNLLDQERTKEYGAKFFLTKPSDFQILCSKLREILSIDFSNDNYFSIK